MSYGRCYCPNDCPRHERDIDQAEDGPTYDPDAADYACDSWERSTNL